MVRWFICGGVDVLYYYSVVEVTRVVRELMGVPS